MASVSPFLMGFPLLVMIVSVFLAGGSLEGTSNPYNICNANDVGTASCLQDSNGASGSTTYSCPADAQDGACKIADACPSNVPPPSYCVGIEAWLLPAGNSISVPNTVLANMPSGSLLNSKNGVTFALGTIGPAGFIVVIGIIIGIVALAGITIFGTGAGTESVHVLFMGGLMMGIWLLLSTLDGFLTNSTTSFFAELNALSANIGTEFYVVLTFMYLLGFIGMVKRGA